MNKIVECVPNFSEGRDKEKLERIVDEIRKQEGVKLLDYSMDRDHNRSVVTFVGEPDQVIEAAFNACKKAAELIDLRTHKGEHPRMGATDVIPLIPIKNISMQECVEYSKKLAKRIGEELNIPVILYEKSASRPEREDLAVIRKGEFEGMFEKLKQEAFKPDFGPDKPHESAGVTAVGARMPLIAFNVNLNTNNIDIAKKIAQAVRGKSGGFKYCKALGFELKERNIVQVSMNMVDYTKTPLYRVFQVIENEANRYGVNVVGSEIVGLVPLNALVDTADYFLKLEDFSYDKVLENRIYGD
ncbi:glutamate formiminotransferase [Petrotoga sp. HWH.PT.55.6.1]|uniref:glutamate formimidoyltransferase n=1 Tax=unclassified Petrotoga TaxID=2620614 RepID=UPI000CA02A04|nr:MULTISPECIES: glutamate formimidoyltransferase [unclassified Petrotoga]MBL5981131.1 glutamate formiminotransferase [Petrotoga sp. 8T1HF07.NaAc.6.1]PNR89429.1 glutamate formiminotransferase [Petrotoga sp. 9T1HF07.CasAA.8.2]PNR93034.1 glutamate formiminotransferase [Petrotoga sp. HWHPT.55.6.3]RLL84015.1 glutamate formiminotransferase [Petrotoga sp. Shatin.DS.tank11.9.2.9.3]RLL90361.1 glutamate formiminotransferase [Petrotoga sp. HKA.pet.4.5]